MDIKKLLESIDSLSEAQVQVPTKGPDGRPIPGQPPVQIRTNFSGPDGSALNAAITTAARTGGMTAIVPDNRTETAAKIAALSAAKRAAMAGESPSVKEEVIDEDDGDSDLGLLKRMAGLIEADDDAEVKPTAGGAGNLNPGNTASGVSTGSPPTTPEPPTTPTTPTTPKAPSQQDIERQGKTGAELMYTSGGQFMNKSDRLNQEKVDSVLGKNPDGTSKFKAGQGNTNLALAAYFKNQQSQPANTTSQTANTTSQTSNATSTTPAANAPTTPAPVSAEPATPAPVKAEPVATASTDSQPQLNVGGVNASDTAAVSASREKLSDIGAQAASQEPSTQAEPAANSPKVSYRERGPRGSVLSRPRNVSSDKFRQNMSRGDYGPIDFTLKGKDGKTIGTVKQGNPDYVKYLDQYTNQLREQAMISEKWAGDAKVKPTGQYAGKSIEELKAMLAKITKSGPHQQGSAEDKRRKQIQFAIRAKKDWKGVVNEAEIPNQGADFGAGLGAGRSDNLLESEDILEDVETSYQVKDPVTGNIEKVSQEKYDELVKKGEIDANVPLDYAFKVRNKKGELETVTYDSDPERWARIASKNAEFLGNLNARLGAGLAGEPSPAATPAAEPASTPAADGQADLDAIKKNAGLPASAAETPPAADTKPDTEKATDDGAAQADDEKLIKKPFSPDKVVAPAPEPTDSKDSGDKPNWFRKLFNIGKDEEGYYLGKERGPENPLFGKDEKGYYLGKQRGIDNPKPSTGTTSNTSLNPQNYNFDDIDALVGLPKGTISEKAPPGREKQVKKLKGKVDNPYAVAWGSYNKSHPKENADLVINNRHKVNESMNFKKLKAAYQEGYAHGLREMGSRFKHYEDMEEAKHYFEGYKCGLEECYGLQPNRGLVDETQSAQDIVDNMASFGAEQGALGEMDKTAYMRHRAKTTPGDTFKAFGQTFNDKEVLETNDFAFESLEKQLNALIKEDVTEKPVNEGISVSMSTGQQGSPDSVSVTATDDESAKLLDFIKQVGLGGLGGTEASVTTVAEPAPAVAVVSDYGGPKFSPHDAGDMSGVLSKLTALSSEDEHDHDHAQPCNECGMMEAKCECEKTINEEAGKLDEINLDAIVKVIDRGQKVLDRTQNTNLVDPETYNKLANRVDKMRDVLDRKKSSDKRNFDLSKLQLDTGLSDRGMARRGLGMTDRFGNPITHQQAAKDILRGYPNKDLDPTDPQHFDTLWKIAKFTQDGESVSRKGLDDQYAKYIFTPRPNTIDQDPLKIRDAYQKIQQQNFKETLDQSEYMVAEDDGEGTLQAGAQEAEINASMPARGGAVNEDVEIIRELEDDEDYKPETDDAPAKLSGFTFSNSDDMKNMLNQIDRFSISNDGDMPEVTVVGKNPSNTNSVSNTSSYEVDGKPANKADYDRAMSNFKMPDMPSMPDMPNLPNNATSNMRDMLAGAYKNMLGQISGFGDKLGAALGTVGRAGQAGLSGGIGSDGEKMYTLPGGSKVNAADFDKFILPPVEVTGKKVGGDKLPGDLELGRLLNLSGANTYDELFQWLKNRGASIDDLQPVKVTGKRIPAGDDELQPVQITSKKRNVGGANSIEDLKAQLDSVMKEESTEKMDKDAENAGKKVAKDIEHDEGHKGKDDNKAEKAGKKVTQDIEYDDKKDRQHDKLDEWANNAGGKGTDASFERDIEFMTKVIAGGLNKPKVTGQTTIPVIASQDARNGDEDVAAWKKLAGIQK